MNGYVQRRAGKGEEEKKKKKKKKGRGQQHPPKNYIRHTQHTYK